jgi:DNA-binding NarL/FixJ family response regulator
VLAARETNPDVILMDVRMPKVDGLQATRKLLERNDTGARILILTTFDLDEYVYEALRAGASGFLLKDTPPEDLVEAIRTVAVGDALLSPGVTCRIVAEFASTPSGDDRPPEIDELTPEEVELLREVARGRSNAEIAEAAEIEEAVIGADLDRILAALQLRDRVHAVVYAHEHGLIER